MRDFSLVILWNRLEVQILDLSIKKDEKIRQTSMFPLLSVCFPECFMLNVALVKIGKGHKFFNV